MTGMAPELAEAARAFRLEGDPCRAEPHGSGHINDTYRLTCPRGSGSVRYILQRINGEVFPDPAAQIENIDRVLKHLRDKEADPRRVLTLVPAQDGGAHWRDPRGGFWRVYVYIEDARTRDVVRGPEEAFQAALVFGKFLGLLSDLPGPRLKETIPGFHDTPARVRELERAAEEDARGRAGEARPEIEFALEHRELAGLLAGLRESGEIPERITHNDTKINNVLFDDAKGEALCVIDLDTVMPGLSLYDFGDLVRTSVSPADEDETDLGKVGVRLPVFEALARGFLQGAGGMLNPAERAHLAGSGKVIALELGMRFLTDFLRGDPYFKTSRPKQNLDRCRAQFRLAELLIQSEPELQRIVDRQP